jgi:LysR family transcriptional activator of glutamate synthase operon
MLVELRHVRYFLAVARHAQFTRAAEELHIVQPALSQQIKQLEQELGVVLFERGSRNVDLTPAGQAFLSRAERILADVENTMAEMRDFSKALHGRVAIGSMFSLGLGPLQLPSMLAAFHARYPEVQVILREGITNTLLRQVQTGEIDIALTDLSIADSLADFAVEPITSEPLVALVGPEHPLAHRTSVRLGELSHERFIRLTIGSPSRAKHLIDACQAEGFTPNFAFAPANAAMARALVSAGLGVYVTHPWVAESDGPPVRVVQLEPQTLRSQIALVWAKGRYRTAAVSAFLDFAWDMLHFRGYLPGSNPSPPAA